MKLTVMILISLLFVQGATKAWAKDPAAKEEMKADKGWKITLESVGGGYSFYTPDMDYWNSVSEIRNWDTKFSVMRLYGGNVEIGVYDRIHVRAEGSYSSATARQTVVPADLGGGSQSKKISLVPVSAIVLYEFHDGVVTPYLGAGAGTVFVNSTNKLVQSGGVTSASSSSQDMMYYAVAGVKLPAARNLFVGIEARGAFGDYEEMVGDTHHVASLQDISLSGFQAAVTVNYRF